MLTQAPRGTRDVLPQDSYRWQYVEEQMRQAAAEAGYREVRTPVFEHTELFLRGVGDTTDIVQKEMYTFQDKGERSITLKPEGTAGAVRCFLESSLYADALPCKMYYLNAPIFRYEAPQSGRLREHHQFGAECFGAADATTDAELILMAYRLLSGLGVRNLSVRVNSIGCPNCRPQYHARLKEFIGSHIGEMCQDCQSRFQRNPLRVLDCKNPKDREIVKNAPSMLDMLCDECRAHFDELRSCLSAAGIPKKVPYSCRHTTATRLAIDEDIAPQNINKVMRWSTTKMLDCYTHPDYQDVLDTIQTLNKQEAPHNANNAQENQPSINPAHEKQGNQPNAEKYNS